MTLGIRGPTGPRLSKLCWFWFVDLYVCWKSFWDHCWKIKHLPQVGLEPTTFGLEVQRAIHCATGAWHGSLFVYSYSDISFKSTRSFSLKILHFWLVYLGPDFFTVSKRHHHRWSERIIWHGVILGTYSVVWVPWWPCRSVYWWVFDREVALKVDFIKNSILWVVFLNKQIISILEKIDLIPDPK